MKIEAKGTIKHHPYYLDKSDTKNVPDDIGQMMVNNGWAVNVETGEDNPPSSKPTTLDIQNINIGLSDQGVG